MWNCETAFALSYAVPIFFYLFWETIQEQHIIKGHYFLLLTTINIFWNQLITVNFKWNGCVYERNFFCCSRRFSKNHFNFRQQIWLFIKPLLELFIPKLTLFTLTINMFCSCKKTSKNEKKNSINSFFNQARSYLQI